MKRRLLAGLTTFACWACLPAAAAPATVWATVPTYPGAVRPLRAWEAPRLAIASTPDAPDEVIGWYTRAMTAGGWRLEPSARLEALAAAAAGAPAWLTFTHPGRGRVDLQIHAGPHPKSGTPVTLIFYERDTLKP